MTKLIIQYGYIPSYIFTGGCYIWTVTKEMLLHESVLKGELEVTFTIDNIEFTYEWFNKIKKDELTAEEVFAIDNVEHRRIAYKYMDKSKMKALKNYQVLDEKVDRKGNQMSIFLFNTQSEESETFFSFVCSQTKREYFLQTKETSCEKAKASFPEIEELEQLECEVDRINSVTKGYIDYNKGKTEFCHSQIEIILKNFRSSIHKRTVSGSLTDPTYMRGCIDATEDIIELLKN